MFTVNPIKAALRSGRVVIGTMIVQVRAPAIIQLFAQYGLEYVFIDMEHGPYTVETAADLIQVARLAGITPFVRVPEIQYHLYARLLDAGAQGIMTPRVETPAQIQQVVRYTRYPPLGERGFSRLAAHVNFAEVDVSDYVTWANDNLLNFVQIESERAVQNLGALITEPGVDGVIVGIDDLSLSIGVPGNTRHKRTEEMLAYVVDSCQRAGIPWGLHIPDVERLEQWIARGMQIVTFSSDIWMLQGVLRAAVARLRACAEMTPRYIYHR